MKAPLADKWAVRPESMWAAALIAREHRADPLEPDAAGVCQCRVCRDVNQAIEHAGAPKRATAGECQ